ncbi:hypothetical protein HHI36_020069 [Cryptolaemus montrouzieri]|uniref:ATPase AAA-type core domain-containing protein n=1 Tax=Cryptolaemus montrouzieri TaxID=559131 RepID=A0ABD2N9L9_9CUCU
MSHKYYDENWKKTQALLEATIQAEPAQADRREHRFALATLYIKYILISNQLSEIIDQMVQVQKRALIKKLLEATLGRILELKYDLVEADINDWTHCGDVMETLGLNPFQTELNISNHFRYERKDFLYRKKFLHDCILKLGFLDKDEESSAPMSEEQAILLVQTHERARQGKLRAQYIKQMRLKKEKSKPVAQTETTEDISTSALCAAIRIQKHWRGYVTRKGTRRNKIQEMVLLGMIPTAKFPTEEIEEDLLNRERRRLLRKQRETEYENAVLNIKQKLEKEQKAVILEQLSDQVRSWMHEYKEHTGRLPEFAGSERTTSRMMMSRQGTDSEISKSTGTQLSSRESKSKRDGSAKSKSKQGEKKDDSTIESKMLTSLFLPELNAKSEEFNEVWKNMDEFSNPKQEHYKDIIVNEEMNHLENSLRKVVNEMMKTELQLLQDALDKDKGFKSKKKSSKKAKRSSKKSKKKKEKDLTPDRTEESLFEELIANGIIKSYPEFSMNDFIGERSYNNPSSYNEEKDPSNALGDIRELLKEYCIAPLLSQRLHQASPHIKSVLIAGPTGSGKHLLVNAICTEVGAILFDLSPANIVGKYPGKSGLIMLMHLVLKVSRLLQPSVIYMNDAEKPFIKRTPKTDKTDPKRLKKDLPKLIKSLAQEDRVILIGISRCPWECEQKLLQTVYQKFVVVPKLDYTSRFTVWTTLLNRYSAIGWQFDTSIITKLSDGYSVGAIIATIGEVLTVKRTLQLLVHPLHPLELVGSLSSKNPVYKEEEEAMEIWKMKTPMWRRRLRAIEIFKEEMTEAQAKKSDKRK